MTESFETWLERMLDSIFQEGVNSTLLETMNWVFYALFAVLTALFLGSGLNIHVFILIIMAVSLYLATNWYAHLTYLRFASELHRQSNIQTQTPIESKSQASSSPSKPNGKSE